MISMTRNADWKSDARKVAVHRKLARTIGAAAIGAAVSLAGTQAIAEEHVIKMLNQGPGGVMIFEPDFVKAEVGDTVVFEPTQPGGHNTQGVETNMKITVDDP